MASKPWILSKNVVLAVQYKVHLVKRVISLVDTVTYSLIQTPPNFVIFPISIWPILKATTFLGGFHCDFRCLEGDGVEHLPHNFTCIFNPAAIGLIDLKIHIELVCCVWSCPILITHFHHYNHYNCRKK